MTVQLNKRQALESVQAMLTASPECPNLLALQTYFWSAPPTKVKTAEQLVARHTAKNDVRVYFNHVFVDKGVMYGTDGNRLAWCATDKPDGFYSAKTLIIEPNQEECGTFPNSVEHVISGIRGKLTTQNLSDLTPSAPSSKNNIQHVRINDFTAVNFAYLRQALNGADTFTTVSAPEGPIGITGVPEMLGASVVIMPVRLPDEVETHYAAYKAHTGEVVKPFYKHNTTQETR